MSEAPRREDPIAKAASSGVGQKLNALRGGGGGLGGASKKELSKLVRAHDGVAMSNHAPKAASDTIGPLEHMLRMVPVARRSDEPRLKVGDPAVPFELLGSNGRALRSGELTGRRAYAMRLTRAMGTGVI